MYRESRVRAIVKTLSWRVLATLATMTLVYIFVRRIDIAAEVGLLEVIIKLILYYFHERAWNRIHKGKHRITPFVLWFTGLSGSGKSTLADKTYDYLKKRGYIVEKLDGDGVREIFPKTGFSKEERNIHIKRIGFLASKLEYNGIMVVASFVSPYKEARDFVRKMCDNFIEVYISASLETCEARDVKGLYKKARAGEIKNFTGVDDPYEIPENPELIIDTDKQTVEESFQQIKHYLAKYL